jgi:light-regulated signal transduction histidine kinase (bacteriophytochrome)
VAVEISLDPIETPDGRCTLASVVDVTQRQRDHDELRRSNAELEQFAYIASHDLQEPLRMVASYTELLAQRYRGRLDEKADKYIFYAVDGAKRMQRLVTDLLAFSRVGSQGKPLIPVAATAVVARATDALLASMRETGALVQAEELPTVLGDEIQLVQLFQNLIGNAIKFRSVVAPLVLVRATRQRDRWVFEVKDNAIGIEMQYADRIFLMFQRLHERGAYEGSGIGLAIVKRIVERHEGSIWVESTPGRGTSFFFTLAAADAGEEAP